MLKIKFKYLTIALVLFAIECGIAILVHDRFIRPYVGDYLVVIMLFYFLRAFANITPLRAALMVLLCSYCIEFLQCFNFIHYIGLENHKWAKIILGNSFEWLDLLTYTLGAATALLITTYCEPKTAIHENKTYQNTVD
jgi:hypothetical protein